MQAILAHLSNSLQINCKAHVSYQQEIQPLRSYTYVKKKIDLQIDKLRGRLGRMWQIDCPFFATTLPWCDAASLLCSFCKKQNGILVCATYLHFVNGICNIRCKRGRYTTKLLLSNAKSDKNNKGCPILPVPVKVCSGEPPTSHGLLNRWTDIFFLPRPAWGEAFNPKNATQTHSIFVKL